MRQVYLDYSATTPVKQEVLDEMIPYFTEHYGNPSSLYTIAQESKEALSLARTRVADLIKAKSDEIFFTAGGTEADNWAIEGVLSAHARKGKHIITSNIEHHAIIHTCNYLAKKGFEITFVEVDKEGRVNPKDVEDAIRDDTVLISIMMVNNEVGTVQPIKEIAEIAKKHKVIFHTDAVQALGNIAIDVKDLGVDLLSMSSHKIYGPKGIGALYIRKGVRLDNLIHGGAQEMKKRAGTENLPGIVGFGKAAQLAKDNFDEHVKKVSGLRDYFLERVLNEIPDTVLNGSKDHRHPGNANITFKFIEGESLLLMLDHKGIAVSTGSACSSASLMPSHVLSAIGVPVEMIHGTLRFTIGDPTTKEDIDYTVDALKEIVSKLRKWSPIDAEKGW